VCKTHRLHFDSTIIFTRQPLLFYITTPLISDQATTADVPHLVAVSLRTLFSPPSVGYKRGFALPRTVAGALPPCRPRLQLWTCCHTDFALTVIHFSIPHTNPAGVRSPGGIASRFLPPGYRHYFCLPACCTCLCCTLNASEIILPAPPLLPHWDLSRVHCRL